MPRTTRRTRRAPRPEQHPPITTFTDAIAQAWTIHEQFRRAWAAFVIAADGTILDGWVLTRRDHTLDNALQLALLGPPARVVGQTILLVSAHGGDDVSVLAEDDIATWNRLRDEVEAAGARLVDWIQAGGDHFRSMHFALDLGDWVV